MYKQDLAELETPFMYQDLEDNLSADTPYQVFNLSACYHFLDNLTSTFMKNLFHHFCFPSHSDTGPFFRSR